MTCQVDGWTLANLAVINRNNGNGDEIESETRNFLHPLKDNILVYHLYPSTSLLRIHVYLKRKAILLGWES